MRLPKELQELEDMIRSGEDGNGRVIYSITGRVYY